MRHRSIGSAGEQIACDYIKAQGKRVITKNYHSRYGEIDIIAEDDKYILFIEVKTRAANSFGTPAEAVSKIKINKIIKTAYDYIAKNPTNLQPRFDVVEIITAKTGEFEDVKINHIQNAFMLEDPYGLF
ncbi:MAG TPA: YraN family protein [Clostridiales bacterium]|nr:YraN family protein [Clostridiales bacterium]